MTARWKWGTPRAKRMGELRRITIKVEAMCFACRKTLPIGAQAQYRTCGVRIACLDCELPVEGQTYA